MCVCMYVSVSVISYFHISYTISKFSEVPYSFNFHKT